MLNRLAIHPIAGPGTPSWASATATAEQRFKEIGEIATRAARAAERATARTGIAAPIEATGTAALLVALPIAAKAIILLALVLVRQHLVGLGDLFELSLGRFVARVNIGVMLARELAIGLL